MKTVPRSNKNRNGLLAGGNWIIDQVKIIDVYPQPEQLGNIRSQSEGTGGSPYNVLAGLARTGVPFPLMGAGLVGKDATGRIILDDCRQRHIDTRWLKSTQKAPTSYTDVMTEQGHGRRTFFHARGANALWSGADLDFEKLNAKIFHLGYLLLLDELDREDRAFGTKAARLLARAREAGIKTSVDVVSEDSDRFSRIVTPALPHMDYCILNEIEAGKTTARKIRLGNGKLDVKALTKSADDILDRGVKELVVIHFPEGCYARHRDGKKAWQPSLNLPQKYIAGSAGAGDAFCAGVLLGLHEEWELSRCLKTGICLAAASLSDSTCTNGIGPLSKSLALAKKFGFRKPLLT